MKIPETPRKRALIVIDMQPAFVKHHNKHIVPNIISLLKKIPYDLYVDTVFYAEKGSLWDKQQNVTEPKGKNIRTVDELAAALKPFKPFRVTKDTRSAFGGDQDLAAHLAKHGIEEVHLVGIETNDCVLATAFDAFTLGFPVYVLEECCESGHPGRHQVGVELLRWQKMTNNSCLVETADVRL